MDEKIRLRFVLGKKVVLK